MQKQYQNHAVTLVRDAKQGDASFDASKDQVIINDGGTEKTVSRSELS